MNKKRFLGMALFMTWFPDFQSIMDWSTLIFGLLSLFGIYLLISQMRQEKNRDIQEMRPYVHVSLQVNKTNSEELEIHILNVGRTPAFNLEIDFTGINGWCHVRPQTHHFLQNNGGIERLLPNENLIYYIGRTKDLQNLATNTTPITVSYQMPSVNKHVKTQFVETQPYNLPGKNYLRSRTSVTQ